MEICFFFAIGYVVNTWNSLPNWVLSAKTTNMFKTSTDKFWHNQDMIYNFRACTIAGSHSEVIDVHVPIRNFTKSLYWKV